MFEVMDAYSQNAVIKVIGVGGGGGNAVTHMVTSGIEGVEFLCVNTDAQALKHSKVKTSLQIGSDITKGLGAGANPDVGRAAALEDRERLIEMIEGSDMLFITAGMGGGTGTGAAPVVAQLAKELGILTVAVVTRPFEMEGNKRARAADNGIAELSKYVDSLITIPNQKLLTVLGGTTTLLDAFKAANQVLQGAVQGIAELITRPGLINVDFADVRTVMSETGMAMMGSGSGTGEGRARVAAEAAVSSPLLEHVDLADAHGILVNVTAGMDMSIGEFQEVGNIVKEFASDDATVVVGTVIDPEMKDELRVTVVATGLNRTAQQGRGRDGFRDSGRDRDYGRDSRDGGRESGREGSRDMGRESREARESGREAMRVVKRPGAQSGNHAGNDYAQLDRPAVQRYARAVGDGVGAAQVDEELLDIPAFLRRQAD
jgi:cell division protein FtsZ